jgi:hypothetical protein
MRLDSFEIDLFEFGLPDRLGKAWHSLELWRACIEFYVSLVGSSTQ